MIKTLNHQPNEKEQRSLRFFVSSFPPVGDQDRGVSPPLLDRRLETRTAAAPRSATASLLLFSTGDRRQGPLLRGCSALLRPAPRSTTAPPARDFVLIR
ncbi:unnamed protein product [Linum trigynum]|uniref:Uncharacterized protein n=1 Tax=Linum trigynum TaxID=586398 RepID=A0AAV2FZD6_9ROSI